MTELSAYIALGVARLFRERPIGARLTGRALDGDNLQRALKAVRDGVADALGIDDGDSRIEWQYGQRRGGKGEYAVEVTIQGAAQ
jgi:hypothetical protein